MDNLTSSMEDYIEAIYLLENQNKVARVSDIGKFLNVKKASVVYAINNLKNYDLIKHEKYGYIILTEKGKEIAKNIYKKHEIIKTFLKEILQISEEIATQEACKIEHILSDETISKFIKFIDFIQKCPNGFDEWKKDFEYFMKYNKRKRRVKNGKYRKNFFK